MISKPQALEIAAHHPHQLALVRFIEDLATSGAFYDERFVAHSRHLGPVRIWTREQLAPLVQADGASTLQALIEAGIIDVWPTPTSIRERKPERDADGYCARCGVNWDVDVKYGPHECPPGYWTDEEKVAKERR